MKCIGCGARMKKTHGQYEYASLPGITLLDIDVYRCANCGEEEVSIPRIEQLNRAITEWLVHRQARLEPAEIRFLRKALGWSGVDLAKHFGVTPETVSRWESGKKRMSPTSERLLRIVTSIEAPVEDYGVDDLVGVAGQDEISPTAFKTTRTGWKAVAA